LTTTFWRFSERSQIPWRWPPCAVFTVQMTRCTAFFDVCSWQSASQRREATGSASGVAVLSENLQIVARVPRHPREANAIPGCFVIRPKPFRFSSRGWGLGLIDSQSPFSLFRLLKGMTSSISHSRVRACNPCERAFTEISRLNSGSESRLSFPSSQSIVGGFN
jgi:hypothetical protein